MEGRCTEGEPLTPRANSAVRGCKGRAGRATDTQHLHTCLYLRLCVHGPLWTWTRVGTCGGKGMRHTVPMPMPTTRSNSCRSSIGRKRRRLICERHELI